MGELLNEKQREAVLATEGYVRVIAGAGSGKTKLLVSRYAYLVKDYGIDSANILCVTFTNKAAGEMRKRIRSLIGDEYDTTLICTYHGFCNRLLREDSEKLFLNKQFQIIDGSQQKAVMAEIYRKYELKLDYATFEAMLQKMGAFKSKSNYVPKMCSPEPCQIMDCITTQEDVILEEFMQRQKATYSLDFHDLIAFAIYALENYEDVRTKWQERLNYIMVDEFQDSSAREMRLVDILSEKYQNLMIVGDPDQNIYEWRGSDVKLLVEFDKEHVPTKTIILNQNYRSTPEILRCANTLIEKNELRLKKDLFTQNPEGGYVVHYHSKNDFDEMDRIIENIRKMSLLEGLSYSDFAILYRAAFLSRIAEKKLVERNIPYEIYGGVKFYQRMEILDVLAYLKLIAYDDDASFKRIINTPRRRFGRNKLILLEQLKEKHLSDNGQLSLFDLYSGSEQTESTDESLFSVLKKNRNYKELQNSDVDDFIMFVDEMRQMSHKLRISEIVNLTTEKSGYEKYIRELGDEERLDNLSEFKRIANEFEREFGENLSLDEFLKQIALQSGEGNDSGTDSVKLMTIHAAKGLEFPVVFLLGLSEGIFPSSKTMEERKLLGLEEERRLCYVAITRAEKKLFLMDSEGTSPKGSKKVCSRFLEEIGADNYMTIGNISYELMQESKRYIAKINSEMNQATKTTTKKEIGDRVEHHAFGFGEIVGYDSRRRCYTVQFDSLAQPRSISGSYFEENHKNTLSFLAEPEKNCITSNNIMLDNSEDDGELEEEPHEDDGGPELKYPNIDRAMDDVWWPDDTMNDDYERDELEDYFDYPDGYKEDYAGKEIYSFSNNEEKECSDEDEVSSRLKAEEIAKEKAKNSPNLWRRDDVPHVGWNCVGVEDLGAPVGICEMCGYQIIRYAHHMEHPNYTPLVCGCICAGKMEGNIDEAKRREAELKKRQARRVGFFKRKWKRSLRGNPYMKIDGHVIVLYQVKPKNAWKYSVDERFSDKYYDTRERAVAGAFDKLEELRNS